jgi:TPR repeat protein
VLIAARAGILADHGVTWRSDVRVWDDAIVRASRARAGLSDAYSTVDEVVDMLERRCRAGGARSCLRAARIAELANGMRVDGARAVALDQKGCELGLDAACLDHAGMYEVGRGVPKDVARAARMTRALCDRGIARGCAIVGMYKMMGTDGPADQRASYELCFSKAPDARWRDWCVFAANSAESDSPQDAALTARLFRQACTLGEKYACERAAALEKR